MSVMARRGVLQYAPTAYTTRLSSPRGFDNLTKTPWGLDLPAKILSCLKN